MRRQSEAAPTGEVVDHIEAVMRVQTSADFIDLSLASPRGSDFYPPPASSTSWGGCCASNRS
jgi:hypothetical protein